MKRLLSLCLSLFTQCGSDKSDWMNHPIAVVAHAELKQPGSLLEATAVEPGDTVDWSPAVAPREGMVQVITRNGTRGWLPMAALALPDSL
jgi:hypothetical protein